MKIKNSNFFFGFYLTLLIAMPLVLLVLPADYFDQGQTVCLSVALFDQECPGCGMTRGIQHLLHLDFMSAATFNKLSFVVLPILMFIWFKEVMKCYRVLFKKLPLSQHRTEN